MVSSKVTSCSRYSGRFCREKNKLQGTRYLSAKIFRKWLVFILFFLVYLYFSGVFLPIYCWNFKYYSLPFLIGEKTRFLCSMHQRRTSSSFYQRWTFVLPQRVTFYATEVFIRSFHRTRLPTSFYDEIKISFCRQYDIYRLFNGLVLSLSFIS